MLNIFLCAVLHPYTLFGETSAHVFSSFSNWILFLMLLFEFFYILDTSPLAYMCLVTSTIFWREKKEAKQIPSTSVYYLSSTDLSIYLTFLIRKMLFLLRHFHSIFSSSIAHKTSCTWAFTHSSTGCRKTHHYHYYFYSTSQKWDTWRLLSLTGNQARIIRP